MYFRSIITIDPPEETVVTVKRPTKVFGKMLHALTAGVFSEREEQETFAAVAVLQQLNMALRSVGITNIVRLAKDDTDVYLDEKGRPDDLKIAVDQFNRGHTDTSPFDRLVLVLEHHEEGLRHLIEITVSRTHRVGEHPVGVLVNSVFAEYSVGRGATKREAKYRARLLERLAPAFKDQAAYDATLARKEAAVDQFRGRLTDALRESFGADEIKTDFDRVVVRPDKSVKSVTELPHRADSEPIYYGYRGWDDYFFYAWLWTRLSEEHDIHYRHVAVVNGGGELVHYVGESGFDAGSGFNGLGVAAVAAVATTGGGASEAVAETANEERTSWLGSLFGGEGGWDFSLCGGDGGDGGDGGGCGGGCGGE